MLTYEEFCVENEVDRTSDVSYIYYGFYCQGYARALIELDK